MGILDSIVEWIATQIMNLLDLVTGSVLGALGCDMSTFLRYFPAAETLYEVFVAIAVGFILLNLVWQLFKNFGLGVGLSAEDPIYKFLDKSERVVVVVDCENSDPYKLYATLNNLNQEALLNKICKIILYDDIHTTSAWKILERFTQIPIEHVLIERIKENKSLVDIRLTTGTCREYYQNNVDSFILVSSDSDYWGLISAMPEVRFFVMVESEKCSPTIKNALINAGISYCYIDDFCTGNSNDIKVAAVLREVRQKLDQAFHLNVRDILDEACRATRADMTTAEKNQFYDKYIKTMHVDISPNGEATIVLGK